MVAKAPGAKPPTRQERELRQPQLQLLISLNAERVGTAMACFDAEGIADEALGT
jgi:hypothetical protein